VSPLQQAGAVGFPSKPWLKLSGPMRCSRQEYPYANVTPLARALVAHASQRLVWGSDWPHVNMNDRLMPNDGDLVDLTSEWILNAATCRRILVDNACGLYGFPKPG
jgi:2-pyrone-4,6-dicarboxylate lactonase